jgi:hypothetical protein
VTITDGADDFSTRFMISYLRVMVFSAIGMAYVLEKEKTIDTIMGSPQAFAELIMFLMGCSMGGVVIDLTVEAIDYDGDLLKTLPGKWYYVVSVPVVLALVMLILEIIW